MNNKNSNKCNAICYACSAHLTDIIKCAKIKIYLCDDCKYEDKTLISKEKALKDFMLVDVDIKKLLYNIEEGIKYYYYYDVFDTAIKKYGSISEFNDLKTNKKRPKIIELPIERIEVSDNKIQRKYDLILALKDICPSFTLSCTEYNEYIKRGKKTGFTFESICETIRNYYFLYKNTNYNKLVGKTSSFLYDSYLKDVALAYYVRSGKNTNIIPLKLLGDSYDILKNYDDIIKMYELVHSSKN
jgi:hypothetical protein